MSVTLFERPRIIWAPIFGPLATWRCHDKVSNLGFQRLEIKVPLGLLSSTTNLINILQVVALERTTVLPEALRQRFGAIPFYFFYCFVSLLELRQSERERDKEMGDSESRQAIRGTWPFLVVCRVKDGIPENCTTHQDVYTNRTCIY